MATDKDTPTLPPVIITEPFQRREMFAAMIESAVSHADALIKKLDAKP